jgi:hypothetical protein
MAQYAYLSGPMRGVAEHNFPAFHHAEAVLREKGYIVHNPARNFGGRVDLPRELYIREDVAALMKSDEVWVLPGWEGSEGAKLEVAIAVATGIPVINYESQTRILPHIALNLLTTSPAGCVVVSSGTATTTAPPASGGRPMKYRFVWNYGTEVVYGGMTRADIEEFVGHIEKMTKFLSQSIYLLMVEELPEVPEVPEVGA